MKNYLKTLTVFIMTTLVVVSMNYCNKSSNNLSVNSNEQNYQELIEKSKIMSEHILAFKSKMEYYRDNPSLKSGGQLYTADSAVIELESLINYDFCYTNITCSKKTIVTSQISIPLDDLYKINDPKLMVVYFNKVIDTIQEQMSRINYSNMKLLAVDIENVGYDSNGDAIVTISSLIGSQSTPYYTTEGWIYGENAGLCSTGWYNEEDAASQLAQSVNDAMIPDPTSGCSWSYSIVKFSEEYNDPKEYPLYTGPLDHDNYLDYKIFFAEQKTYGNVVLTVGETERCLMNYEMNFYKNHYINFAIETENQYSLDHYDCVVSGYPIYNPHYYIQHYLTFIVANRFLKCPTEFSDILTYQ